MKISEILTEQYLNTNNDFIKKALSYPHGAAGTEYDEALNPEAYRIAKIQRDSTKKSILGIPIQTKDINNQEKFDSNPKDKENCSSGYRGLQRVLSRSRPQSS